VFAKAAAFMFMPVRLCTVQLESSRDICSINEIVKCNGSSGLAARELGAQIWSWRRN